MTRIREYLVRTPDGHDYGRDEDLGLARTAADDLGEGATVIALDEFLLPIRKGDMEMVVYTAAAADLARGIPCPYRRCSYPATSEADLDEHLLAMPTSAPEHWHEEDDELPRRTPGAFNVVFGRA